MDSTLLQVLLNKTESETLDFKEQQYHLYGGTDEQKSELLKDILAFANAWKETDAYIVIGVKEHNGRASGLVGVTMHIADNDLQQFVNAKTNKPVLLNSYTVSYERVELDVIRISGIQDRPLFCKRNYGRLNERTVYIRRGSSTAIADPDEISSMGRSQAVATLQTIPTVNIEFADPDERKRMGRNPKIISTTLLDPPAIVRKPDRGPYIVPPLLFPAAVPIRDPLAPQEKDYVRYMKQAGFFKPLGFWVHNTSSVSIKNARFEVRIPRIEGLAVVSRNDGPSKPKYGFKTDFRFVHESLILVKENDAFVVAFDYDRIQPKMQCWSPGGFYVGATQSISCACGVSLFADDLREPIVDELQLNVETATREYARDEWRHLLEAKD